MASEENLAEEVERRSPRDAASRLANAAPDDTVRILQELNPALAQDVLDHLPADARGAVLDAASPQQRAQWLRNDAYPEDTI